jgi:hypothetical protein
MPWCSARETNRCNALGHCWIVAWYDQLTEYLAYVRNPAKGFVSVYLPLGDGIEYSVFNPT